MNPRSWLFCPGDRADRLRNAADSSDVAVADLEDAVHVDAKDAARKAVVSVLRESPSRACRIWVRINNDEHHTAEDLEAIDGLPVAGLMVPKAEPENLRDIAARTAVPLTALIETANGLWQARELAAVERVHTLALGEYDLATVLGTASPEVDSDPLLWARCRIVTAAAAAGLAPPPAPVSVELADPETYLSDTQRLMRFGFFGRLCIHPTQVGLVHEAMRPNPAEVTAARELVQAAEQAEREGLAVLVVRGRMVDPPVVERAREVLDLATAADASGWA